jgi:DNA-binding MarR family transcriptional regulator
VDALELIQLGRQLTKIGEESLRGSSMPALPNGPSLVLKDVFAHPDTSISEIATRTALPQSYVSDSVASLQQQGFVEARTDTKDRRRTLVSVTKQHRQTIARKGAASVDAALARAVGDDGGDQVSATLELLKALAERLAPVSPGPILRQINPHKDAQTNA